MTHWIWLLLLNEMIIVGVYTVFDTGMLLSELGEYIDCLPWDLEKAIIRCIPCMASFHGTLVFWLTQEWTLVSLCTWPFYVLALCGLGKLVAHNLIE